MRLLSLDQASKITGWAIFNDGSLEDYGKIELEEENVGMRLVELRERIKLLILANNIDMVAFEDIQLQTSIGSNVVTFKVLSCVYGIILELLEELGIEYEIVPSVKWKSTLGIKGKKRPEQKQNAQQYVLDTYGVKPTQDECDAICIGTHVLHSVIQTAW